MLVKMWRSGSWDVLLMGMQTGAGTMENSTAVPPKIKISMRSRNSTSELLLEDNENQ